MSSHDSVRFSLEVNQNGPDDPEGLDRLTRSLYREIRAQDVHSVELGSSGPAPAGAKSMDAALIGGVVVAVMPVMVPKLIEFLQTWAMRSEGRSIKIKTQIGDRSIEIECNSDAVSRKDVAHLVSTLTDQLTQPRKKSS